MGKTISINNGIHNIFVAIWMLQQQWNQKTNKIKRKKFNEQFVVVVDAIRRPCGVYIYWIQFNATTIWRDPVEHAAQIFVRVWRVHGWILDT